jgi:ATP phosphoribosyltransferase regulatory subunit
MTGTTLQQNPPLSDVVSRRRTIALTALDVFRGWGYREIEVPLLDYFEPLRRALDPRDISRMFRFVDRDGNLLVLRADVTPAIAKVFAFQLADEPLPLRLCYANKVVRIERAFTRERLESHQLGVELIGLSGTSPEVEVLLVALEALAALGIDDFEIHLNDAAICERLLAQTGLEAEETKPLRRAIAERDPHGLALLLRERGVDAALSDQLTGLTRLRFEPAALDALEPVIAADERLRAHVGSFRQLLDALARLEVSDRLVVDLGLIQDRDYYTGVAFKIVSERIGRALGGGGRYDNLIGRFLHRRVPAVGFALDLDAVLELNGRGPVDGREAAEPPPIVSLADDAVAGFREALDRRSRGDRVAVDHRTAGSEESAS